MRETYLEVTFRRGRPFAAYLYLPRAAGAKSARTDNLAPGLLVDYSTSGEPIGIEITDPGRASVKRINDILKAIGKASLKPKDLAPLRAA